MSTPPGFATLNGIPFRLNPSSIQWGFSIDTNVEETIGGRVVQVIGATLTDMTVSGEYGEKKGYDHAKRHLYPGRGAMLSWELAEAFLKRVRDMMEKQSEGSRRQGRMHPPLEFRFPEFGWHFGVYVKSVSDGKGSQAINHTTGAMAYKYSITLFIVEDRSDDVIMVTGKGTSLVSQKKKAAISGYINRISSGVGWKLSPFNQPNIVFEASTGSGKPPAGKPAGEGKDFTTLPSGKRVPL